MKRLIFRWISIVLVLLSELAQSPAQEPLRAGIDVPEPKLTKKVEIGYPDLIHHWFAGNGPVVADILIDEQGLVTDIEERSYDASVLETFKAAVRQWRFAQTIVDGRAVPVTATLVAVFSLGYHNPYPTDLGTRTSLIGLPPGNVCDFSVTLTHDGQLKEEQYPPITNIKTWDGVSGEAKSTSLKELCGEQTFKQYTLIPEPDTPFSVIESKMQSPEAHTSYRLASSQYSFPLDHSKIEHSKPGLARLYYSTLLTSNGSHLIQLAGIDPDVMPPQFDIDFSHLSESLRQISDRDEIYFFTVFVDDKGGILGVEYSDIKNEAVVATLSKATVIAPGTRNGEPVPTAVIIAIPVK